MGLNGEFQKRLNGIVFSLAAAFILGGIGVVVSLAVAGEKIDQLEEQQEVNASAAKALPVIQNDLEHIRDTLGEIKDYMKKKDDEDDEYHHKHQGG